MKSVFNKRIPTAFGLILLVVAVLATSYLVHTGVLYLGHAAPTDNPQDVRITNITDTSFTVTYKTDAKVIGTIVLQGAGSNNQTVLDERDQQSGVPQAYNLHSISVKNAKPHTTYSFSITSGTTTYQNSDKPFTALTGQAVVFSPSAQNPLTGKVIEPDGTTPREGFVFVTTNNGQFLSTLIKNNGIYIIPLNAFRTSDFSSYVTLGPGTILQILATDGQQNSQVQALVSGTNPMPIITLSNNYNFVVGPTPIASSSASLGFPAFPSSNLLATPIITTPKKDETFSDVQPQFSGKGLPNQSVTIQIHSDALITATVTTDSFGNWTYRPSTPLTPGQHTISITTKNAAGILQTIQQSFTVFASGSQIAQGTQVSPSPTPIPTGITVTPTITPTPTRLVSVSPTIPTTSPTQTLPSPNLTTVVSTAPTKTGPKPTLPPTGSNALVVSSILGLATTFVGIILFVLTKGATL